MCERERGREGNREREYMGEENGDYEREGGREIKREREVER